MQTTWPHLLFNMFSSGILYGCQKRDLQTHKLICISVLASPDWKPIWVKEHRMPCFVNNAVPSTRSRTHGEYLWGNSLAVDIYSSITTKRVIGYTSSYMLCGVWRSLEFDYDGELYTTILIQEEHTSDCLERFRTTSYDTQLSHASSSLYFWNSCHRYSHSHVVFGVHVKELFGSYLELT